MPISQGATNNKRLMTGTGLITFKGRRDMEVLVMGDWSDWMVSGCLGALGTQSVWAGSKDRCIAG